MAPSPVPPCTFYFDLLSSVQGLTSFANAHWYESMAHVLYRVGDFVTANMGADPAHTSKHVTRTLHEVN
ncbi:hypothetical protein V7S43_016044 [Phytophthora oleae]|uniref:Uncharacterized protein n=1 Tax=Phytophthora oleae TaxID=2107226 RepID=A0ABD3EZY6_9STRA